MDFINANGELTIFLEGRIDANNAVDAEKNFKAIITENPADKIIFDADRLVYIASAGLRTLMKIRKFAKKNIAIENTSNEVYEIFEMTGFTRMFEVKKKLREVSIDGCPQVGRGLSSKVYRLDPETIVKVYEKDVPLYKITREIDLAKKSFLAGLPTAISFDLVKCGGAYGVVFEMIADAVTVGDALMAEGGAHFEEIMKKFAALMRQMHGTKVDAAAGFPSIKGTWLDWADGMKKYYTASESDMLHEIISAVPERETIVHCDFHAGNTLYQEGEVVVIDMADVGYAHPVFDFAAGAFHVLNSDKNYIQSSLSLSQEYIVRFFDQLLVNYFQTEDKAELDALKEIFKAFAYLRGAVFPMKHVQISEDRRLFFVETARKTLFPNFKWALAQVQQLEKFF